jgi:arginine-tRNA-protein transferase
MSSACPYPAWTPPRSLPLTVVPEHSCPYFPERRATLRAFARNRLEPADYEAYMNAGFRRSGTVFYQPVCHGCRLCLPIRVPVKQFHPGKTQRRCARRNDDLVVEIQSPVPTPRKFDLYTRYVSQWHAAPEPPAWQEFVSFLYESPVDSIEMTYHDAQGRLLAVGLCDIGPTILSSLYFYFDPAHAHRSLGVFGALNEIALARRAGLSWYYLGYWVNGCASMQYKADYHPHEILYPDGIWRPENKIAAP